MKKLTVLLLCLLLLTGCSAEVYETLGEVEHVSATLPPRQTVVLSLPEQAAVLASSGEDTVYLCGDYTIALQTVSGGDLDATVRLISGYGAGDLTVLESTCGDHQRYDFVWTAAGEGGDQVCRAAVLDDGNYHYCLTVMADAADAGEQGETWNVIFRSFCLEM